MNHKTENTWTSSVCKNGHLSSISLWQSSSSTLSLWTTPLEYIRRRRISFAMLEARYVLPHFTYPGNIRTFGRNSFTLLEHTEFASFCQMWVQIERSLSNSLKTCILPEYWSRYESSRESCGARTSYPGNYMIWKTWCTVSWNTHESFSTSATFLPRFARW